MKKNKKKYYKYLQSKKWKEFRESVFEFFGRFCGLCGSKFNLQVHHKNYKNIFKETFSDVIVLCDRCHSRHHKSKFNKKRKKVDMDTVTYYPDRKQ